MPLLYVALFRFRRAHDVTVLGKPHSSSICFDSGISDVERQKRKENNKLSTQIIFMAWVFEVGQVE